MWQTWVNVLFLVSLLKPEVDQIFLRVPSIRHENGMVREQRRAMSPVHVALLCLPVLLWAVVFPH